MGPPWGIASHRSGWLSSKGLQMIGAGEDGGGRSCTAGGGENWCGHCGGQCGGSLED